MKDDERIMESEKLAGYCEHGNNPGECAMCISIQNIEEKSEKNTLIYAKDFQEIFEANHELSEKLRTGSVIAQTAGINKSIEHEGIQLTLISIRNFSTSYKVEIDGKIFFYKLEMGGRDSIAQYKDTLEAKRRFYNIPWVKVIEPKYAENDNNGKDAIITEWSNLGILADYMGSDEPDETERIELGNKLERIYATLSDYTNDLTTENMFYDKTNRIIYLFDLKKE